MRNSRGRSTAPATENPFSSGERGPAGSGRTVRSPSNKALKYSPFAATVRAHLAAGGVELIATHVDLGLAEARRLDLGPFRAVAGPRRAPASFDEAFA